MQKIEINKYLEIFQVKKVKIMNDIHNKTTEIKFPDDFICHVDEKGAAVSFSFFVAHFTVIPSTDVLTPDKEVFAVSVDDVYWIDENFKLTDNEMKKKLFEKDVITPKGNKIYSSIHARVAAVYTALCEGKIKIGKTNKVED